MPAPDIAPRRNSISTCQPEQRRCGLTRRRQPLLPTTRSWTRYKSQMLSPNVFDPEEEDEDQAVEEEDKYGYDVIGRCMTPVSPITIARGRSAATSLSSSRNDNPLLADSDAFHSRSASTYHISSRHDVSSRRPVLASSRHQRRPGTAAATSQPTPVTSSLSSYSSTPSVNNNSSSSSSSSTIGTLRSPTLLFRSTSNGLLPSPLKRNPVARPENLLASYDKKHSRYHVKEYYNSNRDDNNYVNVSPSRSPPTLPPWTSISPAMSPLSPSSTVSPSSSMSLSSSLSSSPSTSPDVTLTRHSSEASVFPGIQAGTLGIGSKVPGQEYRGQLRVKVNYASQMLTIHGQFAS